MKWMLCLGFLVIPYFFFFTYFEHARLSHRQHKNIFKIEVTEDAVDIAIKGHMSVLSESDRPDQSDFRK